MAPWPPANVAGDSRGREDYEMDVYFDNNALNDLQGLRGVSGDEVHRLRAAAKDRAITPKLSFVNIDEALAALVNHRPLALDLLRLIADFFGLDRMIKPPDRLLTDDFIDLAFGDPPRPPEIQMPAAIRQHLASSGATSPRGSSRSTPTRSGCGGSARRPASTGSWPPRASGCWSARAPL